MTDEGGSGVRGSAAGATDRDDQEPRRLLSQDHPQESQGHDSQNDHAHDRDRCEPESLPRQCKSQQSSTKVSVLMFSRLVSAESFHGGWRVARHAVRCRKSGECRTTGFSGSLPFEARSYRVNCMFCVHTFGWRTSGQHHWCSFAKRDTQTASRRCAQFVWQSLLLVPSESLKVLFSTSEFLDFSPSISPSVLPASLHTHAVQLGPCCTLRCRWS